MRTWLKFFRKKKEPSLILDIGTGSVKALVIKRDKNGGLSVLDGSLAYYDQFSAFTVGRFEEEVTKRAISRAVSDLEKRIGQNLAGGGVVAGLPANVFAARVISQTYERKRKGPISRSEAREITNEVQEEGKRNACQIYFREKGILPSEIKVVGLKILGLKIDGYPVSDIVGLEGRELEFSLLAAILPKFYFEKEVRGFFSPLLALEEMGFEISKPVHQVEGLAKFLVQKPDAVFLDVGEEISQIFLARKGVFEKIGEFKRGGSDFSRLLSEDLGLLENESRDLKHRYAAKELSGESSERIKGFFEEAKNGWFKGLKEKLKELEAGIFPSEIFIFGGGGLLPEIKNVLENGNWEDISFIGQLRVKMLKPSDFIGKERVSPLLDTPQYVPALLLAI